MTRAEELLFDITEYKDRREGQRVDTKKSAAEIKRDLQALNRSMERDTQAREKRMKSDTDTEVLRATAKPNYWKDQGKYKSAGRH